ncbi:hypothetical protein ONS95_008899 [Cadophora gregata]|uniref:uncharacterized protein n=1 Tax=Cadophora gregata TaxID=51156 RepID=UPI0026DBBA8D|nr:uncharacterized protein ONS95_008899 [Cadophora gregata]KAK0123907.1 hypothetical protein ONS95_008899 [Cadophora gregata]KAK0130248.1 hypothetical protein ONS96_000771 [Cadophora gregata f. sp. sojae]
MAAAPKTYFVLTNFDLPPDGPIKLGSIIATPLEPDILNPGDVVEVPAGHVHTSRERDWDITESLRDGQVSVTARFLSSLKLGGTNSTSDDLEITSRFSVQAIETLDFAPSKLYIDEAVNKESIREYLEGCQYELPVFMITGLKIGRGLANGSRGTLDFVIGYRLVRIIAGEAPEQGNGEQEKSKVIGKMLGDDDGRDTDFGSSRVTLTANFDGGREVAAHEIIGSKSVTAIDEDGNTECNCVVVPPPQHME